MERRTYTIHVESYTILLHLIYSGPLEIVDRKNYFFNES